MTEQGFLDSSRHIFRAAKKLGDGALAQLSFAEMMRELAPGANSVAVIVNHLRGNMLSRWTDFLTTDGEKPWRDRDAEFEPPPAASQEDILRLWEEGWACVLTALDSLRPEDLEKTVFVRGQAHSVAEAIHRQLQHYSYHAGQIVMLAKMLKGEQWQTLSIAKGQSKSYKPSGKGGEPARPG